MPAQVIKISGARQHNLKNLHVDIPRQQIVDQIRAYEAGSKIIVLAPLIENQAGEFRDVIEKLKREGFVRARIDGQLIELDRPEPIRLNKNRRHTIEAVVDRLIIRDGIRVRLTDSIETALKLGGNNVSVLRSTQKPPNSQHPTSNTESEQWEELRYST